MRTLLLSLLLAIAAIPAPAQSTRKAAAKPPMAKPMMPNQANDRVFLADGVAWVAHDGSASRLSRPLALTNGGRVLPTGEVEFPGGRRGFLGAGQMLTMSGEVINPITPLISHRLAVRRLNGILISNGKAYLAHDGQAHLLSGSYRLRSGVVVMNNGRMNMPDGTSSMLGNGQLLTFEGFIRNPGGNPAGNSPIRSFPRDPRATTTGDSQTMITNGGPGVVAPLGEGTEAR